MRLDGKREASSAADAWQHWILAFGHFEHLDHRLYGKGFGQSDLPR